MSREKPDTWMLESAMHTALDAAAGDVMLVLLALADAVDDAAWNLERDAETAEHPEDVTATAGNMKQAQYLRKVVKSIKSCAKKLV